MIPSCFFSFENGDHKSVRKFFIWLVAAVDWAIPLQCDFNCGFGEGIGWEPFQLGGIYGGALGCGFWSIDGR